MLNSSGQLLTSSGEARMVKIKDNRASTFYDMLQSNQNWFAYAKQDELYEISSSTGDLLGRYRLKNKIEQEDQLACVYQGKFIGIRQTKGKLTLITGVAEPTTQNSEDVVQQQ